MAVMSDGPTATEQIYAAIAAIKPLDPVKGELVTGGVIVYTYVGDEDEDGDTSHGIRLLTTEMPDWMIIGMLNEGVVLIKGLQNEDEV